MGTDSAEQSERDERIASCSADLRDLFGVIHEAAAPVWLALDLTMTQIRALLTLRVAGSQTVGGLADALSVSEPTASQLVERLVQRGMAERHEDAADRRRVLVSLTPAADEAFAAAKSSGDRTVEEWLQRLGGRELEALTVGLRALAVVSGLASGVVGGCALSAETEDQAEANERAGATVPAASGDGTAGTAMPAAGKEGRPG